MSKKTIPQYVKSAPISLIHKYEERTSFPGRQILGRLLTDDRMKQSWAELKKRITAETTWEKLWLEIKVTLNRSQKPVNLRSDSRNAYFQIEDQSDALAQLVHDGPLDFLAYEYFPTDVMNILGCEDWEKLDSLDRSDKAAKLLKEWPSMPELLRSLSNQARSLASEAMTNDRLVERVTLEYQSIYFVRGLCAYFQKSFNQNLYGTTANIASVVLEKEITKHFVQKKVSS